MEKLTLQNDHATHGGHHEPAVVPEPATYLLLAIGFVFIALLAFLKRKSGK